MRRLRGYLGAAALLSVFGSGCGEELGPERFPTAVVKGSLRLGPQSIGRGWVEFIPIDGTVGNLRSAPIAPDGSFVAEGVAVGRNQIGVVHAPIDSRLSRLFHPLRSPVRRNIPAGDSTLSIDFLGEAMGSSDAP